MPESKEIKFGDIRILIFNNPLNDIYGMKEFRGKFVKLLQKQDYEYYQAKIKLGEYIKKKALCRQ